MSCHKGLQAKSHPNQQLPVTPSLAKRKQVQQRVTGVQLQGEYTVTFFCGASDPLRQLDMIQRYLPADYHNICSNAFRSPTDNLISPCSMRILKSKKYVGVREIDAQQQCLKSDINGKENEGS